MKPNKYLNMLDPPEPFDPHKGMLFMVVSHYTQGSQVPVWVVGREKILQDAPVYISSGLIGLVVDSIEDPALLDGVYHKVLIEEKVYYILSSNIEIF